jgi:hypothetical protein
MNNETIKDFVIRYGAKINYEQGHNARHNEGYTMGRAMDYYSNIDNARVDIELSVRAFKHLVDMDNQAEVDYQSGREEARIRARYPSVAEAYAQYKMLLELCK